MLNQFSVRQVTVSLKYSRVKDVLSALVLQKIIPNLIV